jgi:general stress protein YciG
MKEANTASGKVVKPKFHRFTPETAAAAGRIGGVKVSQDREHMSRIGKLGGRPRKKRELAAAD